MEEWWWRGEDPWWLSGGTGVVGWWFRGGAGEEEWWWRGDSVTV